MKKRKKEGILPDDNIHGSTKEEVCNGNEGSVVGKTLSAKLNRNFGFANVGSIGVNGNAADGSVGLIQDDVYTIGNARFVNVDNRLSGDYENQVGDIMSYIDSGRTAEAMQLAQDLVDHNMSNEVAWLVYAYAKEAWGDKTLAIKGYEQSIAINPKFALAYYQFGIFYDNNEQYKQAVYYLNKALEFDPMNIPYMCMFVLELENSDGVEAAIEKCKYFIDISEEKTELQNILGILYIDLADKYVVDVPDDYQDPKSDFTPGFISLEDIQTVRKYCNEAKSLITLDDYREAAEEADTLLEICDFDCKLFNCHKKWYSLLNAVILFVFYFVIVCALANSVELICKAIGFVVFIFAIVSAVCTVKADYFPGYVINYVWCTGSDDPLKYSRDSFYRNHDTLKVMADSARDGWNSVDSSSDSFAIEILKLIFKNQVWFFKARIQFYKRFIKQLKERKNNSTGTVKTDDIQPQA